MDTSSNAPSKGREGLAKGKEVAEALGISNSQVTKLRFEGRGPAYVKMGRSVRYRWSDVDAWVAANTQKTKG